MTDLVQYVDSLSASSQDEIYMIKARLAELETRADLAEVEGNLIISGLEERQLKRTSKTRSSTLSRTSSR